MNRPFLPVCAAILVRGKTVLLTRRPLNKPQCGFWEFPGGKNEPGEDDAVCLAREMEEELGVKVRVGDLFCTLTHDYPEKTVELHFYFCTLTPEEQTLQPREQQQIAFVPFEHLASFADVLPADSCVIEKLIARFNV